MQYTILIKTKNNFTCIKCADKDVLKYDQNRVYHIEFRMQLYYLPVVIVASDFKVMSSTLAVIFAVINYLVLSYYVST